jgi:hypothetical protein
MSKEVVVVFTAKSIERILAEGGTSAWRLAPNHARRCEFVICTRNSYPKWEQEKEGWTIGPEPHHTAFLVGKIQKVIPAIGPPEDGESPENRYMVQLSEFARVNVPNVWKGDRNPVKYMSPDGLGINFSKLKWEAMPVRDETATADEHPPVSRTAVGALTIPEAKKGLALTFNVPPEAIEITIRG